MRLPEDECRRRFRAARVLRLATVGEPGDERASRALEGLGDGQPHLVPATFAVLPRPSDVLVMAVDDKPKRHHRLKRLRNIERNPAVSALVDAYDDEDWSRLWWVRADGTARVLDARAEPLARLAEKYPQYRTAPPRGPVVEITVTRWSGWSAADPPDHHPGTG